LWCTFVLEPLSLSLVCVCVFFSKKKMENHKVIYSFAFFFLYIRVSKEKWAAGVLDNFAEGEMYAEHFLRKFVRNKSPEIMLSINKFFTDPNRS